jgi:hypothetical protein
MDSLHDQATSDRARTFHHTLTGIPVVSTPDGRHRRCQQNGKDLHKINEGEHAQCPYRNSVQHSRLTTGNRDFFLQFLHYNAQNHLGETMTINRSFSTLRLRDKNTLEVHHRLRLLQETSYFHLADTTA